MKKLLILITVVVCFDFFLVLAGVPITNFLKGSGVLAIILAIITVIGALLIFGGFYAIIIILIFLPMLGGLFFAGIIRFIFHWRSEFFFWLGFVLTIFQYRIRGLRSSLAICQPAYLGNADIALSFSTMGGSTSMTLSTS